MVIPYPPCEQSSFAYGIYLADGICTDDVDKLYERYNRAEWDWAFATVLGTIHSLCSLTGYTKSYLSLSVHYFYLCRLTLRAATIVLWLKFISCGFLEGVVLMGFLVLMFPFPISYFRTFLPSPPIPSPWSEVYGYRIIERIIDSSEWGKSGGTVPLEGARFYFLFYGLCITRVHL